MYQITLSSSSLLVGVLYPAYASFKAVKHKDHRAYVGFIGSNVLIFHFIRQHG